MKSENYERRVFRRSAQALLNLILLIFVAAGSFVVTGCNLQNGGSGTDGETIEVRATVTVKDRSNGSAVEGATVTIEPTVTTDGPTYYFEEASGNTNTLGVVTVTAEKAISTPGTDITGTMPKITITITHEEYRTGNFVEYGSGLKHDEENRTYRSSLTVVENVSPQ